MYHGNALVKDFQGIETTRESIEKVKMSKDIINRTGMPTTVYISDTEVKITIFGGQEPLHQHEVPFAFDKYEQIMMIFFFRLGIYPASFMTRTTCACSVISPLT